MLGDAIMATPIPRLLRAADPNVDIDVMTEMTAVFCSNPHIRGILPYGTPVSPDRYSRIIVLDRAYEMRPKMHASHAYALETFGTDDFDLTPELFSGGSDIASSAKQAGEIPTPYIAIHARNQRTWPSRNIPEPFWRSVVNAILGKTGHCVVAVGDGDDHRFDDISTRVFSLVGKLNLHQTCGIISRAKAFVGFDSGLLHVAACTPTPIVGLFSTALPEYRAPLRADSMFVGILSDVPCAGCQHNESPPVLDYVCRRGDNICINGFSVESVISALQSLEVC